MTNQTAHRVTFTAKHGALAIVRVHNAPDCDMAAMQVLNAWGGSTIKSVDAIDEDAIRAHGEVNF